MRGSILWGGPGKQGLEDTFRPPPTLVHAELMGGPPVRMDRPGRRHVPHIQAARACEQEPPGGPRVKDAAFLEEAGAASPLAAARL